MGGERTFVAFDDMEHAQRNTVALGEKYKHSRISDIKMVPACLRI